MKNVLLLTALSVALSASPAFAAGHCVGKDGTEITVTAKKGKVAACKAAGGQWVKATKKKTAKK
jgi:hypothetical protein